MPRPLPTYEQARIARQHWMWMRNIRPASLQAVLLKATMRSERLIVTDAEDRRFYIDPFTNAGWQILQSGVYEPETVELLKAVLRPGDCFLDVGANEGIVSSIAGTIVGAKGTVVALEPQRRLLDLIDINCSLNGVQVRLIEGALGGPAGATAAINLFPTTNTGASGLMRRARFSWRRQETRFIDVLDLLSESGREWFDLVKVDVEGFEGEVIDALYDFLRSGKVRHLLLDYHVQILGPRGIDAEIIHQRVLQAGMIAVQGETTGGYVLYSCA